MELNNLSKSAARLLLAYICYGPAFHELSLEAQMKQIGVSNRGIFLGARTELQAAGWVDFRRDGRRGLLSLPPPLTSLLSLSIVGWLGKGEGKDGLGVAEANASSRIDKDTSPEIYLSSIYLGGSSSGLRSAFREGEPPDVRKSGTSEVQETGTSEVQESGTSETQNPEVQESGTSDVRESGTSEVQKSGTSLITRIIEADAMDDTGPETSTTSLFQRRRKVQAALVQEAWLEVFPDEQYPLTLKNAKSFLTWCENSAQEVYEELKDIKQRYNPATPLGYVSRVLQSKKSPKPALPPQQSGKGVVESRPTRGAAAYVLGGDLPLPSEEWLEEVAELHTEAEINKKARGWEE